jgi:hypothetical protein
MVFLVLHVITPFLLFRGSQIFLCDLRMYKIVVTTHLHSAYHNVESSRKSRISCEVSTVTMVAVLHTPLSKDLKFRLLKTRGPGEPCTAS